MAELLIGCGFSRDKHIGLPGREKWDGLVTLDANPNCKPDVVHDLDVMPYPFEDNIFDEVHAIHVLEHLGRQGDWKYFFAQWEEIWRITKPDGVFCGVTPVWNGPWAWGDPSHTRIISLESLAFLDQKAYENVGKTNMSDFRAFYKASWELTHNEVYNGDFVFVLRARK